MKILDNNLANVMGGNITAEEAAARVEKAWNAVTEDVGLENQIEAWRKGVDAGLYVDRF
jgi:hypothetical protein